MVKNITLKLKHIMLLSTLALFSVAASAANVTYSLTTHVDGRTITGTANLAEGADLLNAMPQALWRAYCTYTFTNKDGEEITTAPAEGGTVYVDYEFDPPFIMSVEGAEPTWNYLRSYNAGGDNNYIVYYSQWAEDEWGSNKQTIKGWKSTYSSPTPTVGRNRPLKKAGHDQWAFYGDPYSFFIKVNDPEIANPWLIWRSTSNANTAMGLGSKPAVGWQLYVNTATNNKLSRGTVAMGPYNATNYLASLENVSSSVETDKLDTSKQYFDSHNQLVHNQNGGNASSTYKKNLWWYAFFATPTTESPTSTDLWHVTYKIQKIDGTWYADIVNQKKSSNLKPSFPPTGFTPSEDYAYDYFYMDAEFAEKCAKDYEMPDKENTVLYLREVEFTSTPWMTLVLPYDIEDLDAFFGKEGVRVKEYTSVDGQLTETPAEAYFNCNLHFTATDKIVAYMPYLFKADRVNPYLLEEMYYTVEDMQEPIEVKLYDDANAANIGVSMKGVLTEGGYEMPGDGLNFFFGSVKNGEDDYSYNFYRRGATIPQFRCYFFVTDERTGAETPIKVRFGSDSLTGISTMTADTNVNAPIYSLDGRKLNNFDTLKKGIYIINGRKVVK